jgi:hypothetical protein
LIPGLCDFLVHRAALRKALLRVLRFSTVVIIPLVLHPRPLLLPSLCNLSNCPCPETLRLGLVLLLWRCFSPFVLLSQSILCTTQSHSLTAVNRPFVCFFKKNLQCKLLLLPVGTRCHPAQDAPQNTGKCYKGHASYTRIVSSRMCKFCVE